MALVLDGQCSRCQHPDRDRAHAGVGGFADQTREILRAGTLNGPGRRRIQGVGVALDGVVTARANDLMHSVSVAHTGDADEAGQAGRPDLLQPSATGPVTSSGVSRSGLPVTSRPIRL